MYSFRKYPYPPQARLMEIPRGRGFQKHIFFKGKYDAKLLFLERWGWGFKLISFCGVGVDIFINIVKPLLR